MSDLLASVFGGGSQQAPVLPTYDPSKVQGQFLSQDFAKNQAVSDSLTANTSKSNLSTNLTGLNTVDSGALAGINAQQQLGNTLLAGSGADLPAWAQAYLNTGQRKGAESAIGRGVGAFSGNGLSGVNQFLGNNAMNLVGFGSQLATGASNQAQGIVSSNMYRSDPMAGLLTPGQFMQAGEFNTGIQGQNAINATAAANYNANNSPLGSAIRTGLQDLTYLAGSFLGGAGKMAMA